jgi:hypothetical protein
MRFLCPWCREEYQPQGDTFDLAALEHWAGQHIRSECSELRREVGLPRSFEEVVRASVARGAGTSAEETGQLLGEIDRLRFEAAREKARADGVVKVVFEREVELVRLREELHARKEFMHASPPTDLQARLARWQKEAPKTFEMAVEIAEQFDMNGKPYWCLPAGVKLNLVLEIARTFAHLEPK